MAFGLLWVVVVYSAVMAFGLLWVVVAVVMVAAFSVLVTLLVPGYALLRRDVGREVTVSVPSKINSTGRTAKDCRYG